MGSMILLNALTIGLQTDYASRNVTNEFPPFYPNVSRVFCAVFTIELALRIYVSRRNFFCKREKNVLWNYFDLTVVGAQILDESLLALAATVKLDFTHFRLVR